MRGMAALRLFQSTPDLVNRENALLGGCKLGVGCFNPLPI